MPGVPAVWCGAGLGSEGRAPLTLCPHRAVRGREGTGQEGAAGGGA